VEAVLGVASTDATTSRSATGAEIAAGTLDRARDRLASAAGSEFFDRARVARLLEAATLHEPKAMSVSVCLSGDLSAGNVLSSRTGVAFVDQRGDCVVETLAGRAAPLYLTDLEYSRLFVTLSGWSLVMADALFVDGGVLCCGATAELGRRKHVASITAEALHDSGFDNWTRLLWLMAIDHAADVGSRVRCREPGFEAHVEANLALAEGFFSQLRAVPSSPDEFIDCMFWWA
jgi:hypothetical protein